MTFREIRNELENIYQERCKWNWGKGPFTDQAIRKRELILIKQQVLYQLEEAKLLKDKYMESFNLALLSVINRYLNLG